MSKIPDWEVVITRTENGFVAEYLGELEGDEGVVVTKRVVFEETGEDSLEGMEKLLWFLLNFFDKWGGRYDKERLRVARVPGDKYEESPKEKEKANG